MLKNFVFKKNNPYVCISGMFSLTIIKRTHLVSDLLKGKSNIKTDFGNEGNQREGGKILNPIDWSRNGKLFSNFKENFFGTEFSGDSFDDWKSTIEERSNEVLQGYNNRDYKSIKDPTGEIIAFL